MSLPILQEQGGALSGLARGVGQGLEKAMPSIQDLILSAQNQKKMKGVGEDILAIDPKNPTYQIMSKVLSSGLPGEQQNQIMKLLATGQDPYKMQQQIRLDKTMWSSIYRTKINELQQQLKTAGVGKERIPIQNEIKRLQDERDQVLGFSNEMEDIFDVGEAPGEPQKAKVKFDPNNKEHVKKREQLLKHFKGDQKKVNEQLAKEFTK